jgi:hypothetical protein
VYELNCQEKKIGTITKESRKIGASYKNYNFCMHSRSQLTIGTIYLINSFFFCSICPGMEITQLNVFNRKKKKLEDLEKNLEKLN